MSHSSLATKSQPLFDILFRLKCTKHVQEEIIKSLREIHGSWFFEESVEEFVDEEDGEETTAEKEKLNEIDKILMQAEHLLSKAHLISVNGDSSKAQVSKHVVTGNKEPIFNKQQIQTKTPNSQAKAVRSNSATRQQSATTRRPVVISKTPASHYKTTYTASFKTPSSATTSRIGSARPLSRASASSSCLNKVQESKILSAVLKPNEAETPIKELNKSISFEEITLTTKKEDTAIKTGPKKREPIITVKKIVKTLKKDGHEFHLPSILSSLMSTNTSLKQQLVDKLEVPSKQCYEAKKEFLEMINNHNATGHEYTFHSTNVHRLKAQYKSLERAVTKELFSIDQFIETLDSKIDCKILSFIGKNTVLKMFKFIDNLLKKELDLTLQAIKKDAIITESKNLQSEPALLQDSQLLFTAQEKKKHFISVYNDELELKQNYNVQCQLMEALFRSEMLRFLDSFYQENMANEKSPDTKSLMEMFKILYNLVSNKSTLVMSSA